MDFTEAFVEDSKLNHGHIWSPVPPSPFFYKWNFIKWRNLNAKNEWILIDYCNLKEKIDTCSYFNHCKFLLLKLWIKNLDFGKEEDLFFSHIKDLILKVLFLFWTFANRVSTKQFCLFKTHLTMMINLPIICSMLAHCLLRQILCSQIIVTHVNIDT